MCLDFVVAEDYHFARAIFWRKAAAAATIPAPENAYEAELSPADICWPRECIPTEALLFFRGRRHRRTGDTLPVIREILFDEEMVCRNPRH